MSKAEGKPFAFSEWGAKLVAGDTGAGGRLDEDCARYFESVGAEYAAYFDAPVVTSTDCSTTVQKALRDMMAGAF